MANRSKHPSRSRRPKQSGRPRRPKGSHRPKRLRRSRITIPAAAALLFGCDVPCDMLDGGPGGPPRYCVDESDMLSVPDMGADCTMWMCKQNSDCPPTLCPTAMGFGVCRSGTCVWK